MKRILSILLALLLLVSLVSLAACSEGDDAKTRESTTAATEAADKQKDSSDVDTSSKTDDSSSKADDSSSEPDDTTSEPDDSSKTNSGSTKQFATLEDYLNDPVNSKGMDELKESGQGVMDIDVRADGNTLVYDYSYVTTMDADVLPTVKSTLESALDSSEESFVSLAGTMQNQIDEKIKIKVVYRNGDGAVITERTFEP